MKTLYTDFNGDKAFTIECLSHIFKALSPLFAFAALYDGNVLPVLLYGQNAGGSLIETVRFPHFMPEKDMQDILVQKITNKKLFQKTCQRDITIEIKQRRWRWLGHVIRKDRDSITRTALKWTPNSGRRKRGRPRESGGERSRLR